MPNAKTATLSFRIEPILKGALRIAAKQEHRSIANMVEVMIREYCARVGIDIPEQTPMAEEGETTMSNENATQRTKKKA